jgi:outer membrane protein TolC
MRFVRFHPFLLSILLPAVFVAGCEVGPKYTKASAPTTPSYKEAQPESFKEAGQWKTAQPSDQALRGKWWESFGDPQLNSLEEQLTVSNQDLKVAEARLREARATVRFNRAAEFPTISTGPSISGIRDSANRPYFTTTSGTGDFVRVPPAWA